MKTETLSTDFECNVDTCNEEIARLSAKLGQTPPDFIANVYDANEKIEQLNAELAKKADVVVQPTPKLNVAPKPTDPPAPKRKPPQATGTGLFRAINANLIAQGKTPIATSTTSKKDEPFGLQRSIEANIKAQKSKSNE